MIHGRPAVGPVPQTTWVLIIVENGVVYLTHTVLVRPCSPLWPCMLPNTAGMQSRLNRNRALQLRDLLEIVYVQLAAAQLNPGNRRTNYTRLWSVDTHASSFLSKFITSYDSFHEGDVSQVYLRFLSVMLPPSYQSRSQAASDFNRANRSKAYVTPTNKAQSKKKFQLNCKFI